VCTFCLLAGNIKYCSAFLALSASEKIAYLSYNIMCSKCLSFSHISTSCASSDKDYASYLTSKAQLSLLSIPKVADEKKNSEPEPLLKPAAIEVHSNYHSDKSKFSPELSAQSKNQIILIKIKPQIASATDKSCKNNFSTTSKKYKIIQKPLTAKDVHPLCFKKFSKLLSLHRNLEISESCRSFRKHMATNHKFLMKAISPKHTLTIEPKPPWILINILRAPSCVKQMDAEETPRDLCFAVLQGRRHV